METAWRHPFTAILAGPTGCGKTQFTFRFIREVNQIMTPPPDKIVYCYGEYQNLFSQYPHVEFNQGLPDVSQFDGGQQVLLLLDDLMGESGDVVEKIFTKFSHHRNISIMYLSQNLFYKSKQNRTMSLNAHYLVIFKNPRDQNQLATLARQMYPGNAKFLIEAFGDATSKPYGYLLIDLKPDTDERLRIRTNIFKEERQIVYVRK
jgi:hypothetical protein